MTVTIKPSRAVGTMKAPPSKSQAHRLLISGALCKEPASVSGVAFSKDIEATLLGLRALGAEIKVSGDTVTLKKGTRPKTVRFDCMESGSTLRFLLPMCLTEPGDAYLYAAKRLLERPQKIYEDLCKAQNITYEATKECIHLCGALKSGDYEIPGNVSSQFVSGLLFTLPQLSGDSTITLTTPLSSRPYVEMTLAALKSFGAEIFSKNDRQFSVKGNTEFKAASCIVEGDYSNAAFFDAFNTVGGNVTVTGLSKDTLQGDAVYKALFSKLSKGQATVPIDDCPDLGPILIAVMAANHGGTLTGTRRLKIKESDRGAAMAEELKKFGVEITVSEDTIFVPKGRLKAPTEKLSGHNDHRIVMALSFLLSLVGGTIEGAEAVAKSLPDYFKRITDLGIEVEEL